MDHPKLPAGKAGPWTIPKMNHDKDDQFNMGVIQKMDHVENGRLQNRRP